MNKTLKELEMLLKMDEAYGEQKATVRLSDYPPLEQEIIKSISKLFLRFCNRLTLLNLLFIATKIVKLVSIIFFALLIFEIFPYYIVVIILLLLNPLLSIAFKMLLYSNYEMHKKIEELLKPLNIGINELMDIIENDLQ